MGRFPKIGSIELCGHSESGLIHGGTCVKARDAERFGTLFVVGASLRMPRRADILAAATNRRHLAAFTASDDPTPDSNVRVFWLAASPMSLLWA